MKIRSSLTLLIRWEQASGPITLPRRDAGGRSGYLGDPPLADVALGGRAPLFAWQICGPSPLEARAFLWEVEHASWTTISRVGGSGCAGGYTHRHRRVAHAAQAPLTGAFARRSGDRHSAVACGCRWSCWTGPLERLGHVP